MSSSQTVSERTSSGENKQLVTFCEDEILLKKIKFIFKWVAGVKTNAWDSQIR